MNSNTMNNDVTMAGESKRALLANRYRIVMQLGQGGMGSVWLAEDTQLDGKLFAIKMLPSILVSNKRAYNQLKAEALVAMKLVHPNIVQIRAFEENDGNPFLVMDYIDGETLDEWLGDRGQESGASEEEVIRLLKPIAEAIDYAHTEGVVHRDIKPANVMIRKDGRPFIMDFGIAREIQETMTRVTGKLSSGTLMYMSPEQLNGDMPKPSQDVYSFAAMVYECLKGEPPFCRGAIEDQIKNKAPEVLGDDITVASSVMAGLAKRSEDRPKTCADVLKVNSNTLQSSSKNREVWPGRSPLREAKSQETCERPRQPHQGLFGNIAAIILLVFGLVGGIWYWQGTHENGVVSDSLIPAKPSAKPNPPPPSPPLSGPTELDVVEIKVESSVQKERIGRIDDADGFKVRKDGLSDLYIKAVAYENAKSWSNAAINYTNYVEGCKALLALNNERNLADKNRKIAEAAKVGAEGADSAKYVSVQWNEALANAKIAGEKFAAMEFAKASHLYENAAGQFLKCELNAKKECARLKKEEEQRDVALREKERLAAVDARSFALKESKRTEEEGAKQYAVDSWNRIVADWKSADDLLKEKRYAEAKNKFDEIAKAYADCIEETQRAKIARERQVLEALATNPGKVLKKDLFTPKLKKYEWICTEILRVQGELSALLLTFTEEHSEVRAKREELNELLEQFVKLMEKDGLGDKARKAFGIMKKGDRNSDDFNTTVIIRPYVDEKGIKKYVTATISRKTLSYTVENDKNNLGGSDIIIKGENLPSVLIFTLEYNKKKKNISVMVKRGKTEYKEISLN